MQRRGRRITVAAVSVLAACGGGETQQEADNRNAFCASALIWTESVGRGFDDTATDAFELMLETATGEVREALETMVEIGPDSIRLSKQDAYDDARATVNDFLHDRCDLDISV